MLRRSRIRQRARLRIDFVHHVGTVVAMTEKGKYIYGVILARGKLWRCDEVYTIPHEEISAVVADSEAVDYTKLERERAARLLVKHQQTLEKVMESFPVLPMRLGSFARDTDEAMRILAKARPIVGDIFAEVEDKTELDITATWADFDLVVKEVGDEREIKEAKEKLTANGAPVTVGDQMKVGLLIKKALDKKNCRCSETIVSPLAALSRKVKLHERMDDKMVINAAFLVENCRRDMFDQKVEELDVEFDGKLNFRRIGPLPPYSFYTLEVQEVLSDEVEWAREILDVSDENLLSKDDIRKAYRAKAFCAHPDSNPELPETGKAFEEVTSAYRTLLDYCQAELCSVGEEEFAGKSLIVRVRE